MTRELGERPRGGRWEDGIKWDGILGEGRAQAISVFFFSVSSTRDSRISSETHTPSPLVAGIP